MPSLIVSSELSVEERWLTIGHCFPREKQYWSGLASVSRRSFACASDGERNPTGNQHHTDDW